MRATPDAYASGHSHVRRAVCASHPFTCQHGRPVHRAARAREREPRGLTDGRIYVKLVRQSTYRAKPCTQAAARRNAVADRTVEVVNARPRIPVDKLQPRMRAERGTVMKPAARARIGCRVRPDLLHDDVNLGQ